MTYCRRSGCHLFAFLAPLFLFRGDCEALDIDAQKTFPKKSLISPCYVGKFFSDLQIPSVCVTIVRVYYFPMKLFNITDIFNNIVTMSPGTLEAFHDTLKANYKELARAKDLDNLKVLRNRIQTIIENNSRKFSDSELKKVSKIRKLLRKMNATIEEIESQITEPIELIDVVQEVRKKYEPMKKLSEKQKMTHVLVKMKKSNIDYEEELTRLQLELVKLQRHMIQSGKRLLIIFEGRDAAGKGGTIQRFTETLNPRSSRIVALQKPSDTER